MTPALETPRLLLKPLELNDVEAIQSGFPHWEIVRYLADRVPWPYPPDGALAFVRDVALPGMESGDAWHWSLRLKEDPSNLIGCINLVRGDAENRGFWLAPAFHHRGLMSEASLAVTDFWFETLGFPVLRVPKAVANGPSRRISEKQAMRVVWRGEKGYVGGRMDCELWEITADEWRRFRGQ